MNTYEVGCPTLHEASIIPMEKARRMWNECGPITMTRGEGGGTVEGKRGYTNIFRTRCTFWGKKWEYSQLHDTIQHNRAHNTIKQYTICLNVFYAGIKCTETDLVLLKLRHYPLL